MDPLKGMNNKGVYKREHKHNRYRVPGPCTQELGTCYFGASISSSGYSFVYDLC